jgi:hypothetical protein
MESQDAPDTPPVALSRLAYERLVQRARALADKALRRLEELRGLYPSDLAEAGIVAVRRCHDKLPGEPPRPDGPKRRRAPRLPAGGRTLTLTDAQAPGPSWEAVLVDLSWGGFSCRADRPLALGSVVAVGDAADPGVGPPPRAEVKSCRSAGEAWVIGCALLPTPEPGGGA